MPDLTVARRLRMGHLPHPVPGDRDRPAWWPAWSRPAAIRTLRAVLVIPSLFALTLEGFGNLQIALFAAFGGFATLIMASFGQAAFTVVVLVLFNLLAPAGWTVGLLRIEDVAIGCVVSLAVGFLFWPRGASSVVGDDLADAFRRGAAYLTQSVDWALGTRHEPPDAGAAAVTAGIRLDEALRGFLAEQGAKRVSKEDLWMLVMASMRLRLTAYSLAGLQAPEHARRHAHQGLTYARTALAHATADLAGFYERIAVLVGRPVARQVLMPAVLPAFTGLNGNGSTPRAAEVSETDGVTLIAEGGGPDLIRVVTAPRHPHLLWVAEHLQHLNSHAHAITDPASHVAEQRRLPWWR